jgi:hypothetical protein
MEEIHSSSELVQILHSFIDGGWLVLVVGVSGMMARLALFSGKVTILECIKKLFAAMICSSITWFILEEIKMHFMYKAIIYTLAGLDAPELMKGAMKLAQGFAQDPHSFLVQLRKGKLYGGKEHNTTNSKSNHRPHRTRSKQK